MTTKTKKFLVNGAVIVGILNAIINAIRQLDAIQVNPDLKFDWQKLLKAAGKGAVVGGVGGAAVGAYIDYRNSNVKPINTDAYLMKVADNVKLDRNHPSYLSLNNKANYLIRLLRNEFGSAIHSTPRLGSTESGTALSHRFDIDIAINFKPKSFSSTKEMFFSVLNLIEEQVGKSSIFRVRDQKKSVGVFFKLHEVEHKIDVVPCKLTNGAKGAGYLYVNHSSLLGSSSYTKTNIRALNAVKLSPTQQRIALVLKKWKDKENLPMSSHLLQNLILDAYSYSRRTPMKFTDKVVMVIRHIADSLDKAVIRGVENTNNIITDIPDIDKEIIIEACQSVIDDYQYQPNSIVRITQGG